MGVRHVAPGTRRCTGGVALALLSICASLTIGAGPAGAALPKKGSLYRGITSQRAGLTLQVASHTRRGIDFIETEVRTQCGKLRPIRIFDVGVSIPIRRDGRFSDTTVESDWLELADLVTVDGRRRRLFDITATRITGRFLRSGRAVGTWRTQSALYDINTFPADDRPVDRCDTGLVTWRARSVRARGPRAQPPSGRG